MNGADNMWLFGGSNGYFPFSYDYDYYYKLVAGTVVDDEFRDVGQLPLVNSTINRNNVCFDGVANIYNTQAVIGPNDVAEVVLLWNSFSGTGVNGSYSADGGPNERFYFGALNTTGEMSIGYRELTNTGTGTFFSLATMYNVSMAGNGKLYLDGVEKYDASANTGPISSLPFHIGGMQIPNLTYASFSDLCVFSLKISRFTDIDDFDGTNIDEAASVIRTYTCKRSTVSTDDSEMIDTGPLTTNAISAGGADLTALYESDYDITIGTSLTDASALVANPIPDDTAFTLFTVFKSTAGTTRETTSMVLFGGEDVAPVDPKARVGIVTDGANYIARVSDGTTNQEIYSAALPTSYTSVEMVYDGTKVTVFVDGSDVTSGGVTVTLANVVWPTGNFGVLPTIADSDIQATDFGIKVGA